MMVSTKRDVIHYFDGDRFDKIKRGTKTLIIDGSVKNIPNGHDYKSPFPGHRSIEEIIIKEGVESIGNDSFAGCRQLKAVSFPSTLKVIGVRAFVAAFTDCRDLITLIVPPTVISIEEDAFKGCTKLSVVDIHKSTVVHPYAFMGCTYLPSFMLKRITTSEINESTYHKTLDVSQKIVIIKGDVKQGQFKGNNSVICVDVENGVKKIHGDAFESFTALQSISLPESLEEIGNYAFKGCTSLCEITIPENVKEINEGLFEDCTSLRKIILSSSTTKIGNYAFRNCIKLERIKLPETLIEIHYNVFSNCSSLKEIELPKSLIFLGGGVFSGCTYLEKVTMNEDSKTYSINESTQHRNSRYVFMKVDSTCFEDSKVYGSDGEAIRTILKRTFYQCSALREIKIPSTVSTIDEEAFYECRSLKSVNIHDNIESIGRATFAGCTSLRNIFISRSVVKVDNNAFFNCKSLKSVTLSHPDIEIGDKAFAACDALETISGLPSDENNITSYMARKVFEGCRALETPLGNEIHLIAEGKCWSGNDFPQNSHLWLKRRINEENEERKNNKCKDMKEDVTFRKDYNGDTAFQCAVRGGAPDEYLKLLAQGEDKEGKTHLDRFAEEHGRKQAKDFSDDELAFHIEEFGKLIAVTPIGKGANYLNSFEELLENPIFDPWTVPEFIEILNNHFETRKFVAVLMLDVYIPLCIAIAFSVISGSTFDEKLEDNVNTWWYVLIYFSVAYLCARELLQLLQGFFKYVGDVWNYLDLATIVLTLTSTMMMHLEMNRIWMKELVIAATFFIWLYIVMKLRCFTEKFALFVSGIINILHDLLPFFVVTVILLFAFAHMFYINNSEDDYKTRLHAFLRTLSNFFSFDGLPFTDEVGVIFKDSKENEDVTVLLDQQNSLDWNELLISTLYGAFVVVLLLNVVIAVVSKSWESTTGHNLHSLLLYRISLFLELDNIINISCIQPKPNSESESESERYHSLLSPDGNYCVMWGDSRRFTGVRIKEEGFSLIKRILLHLIYMVLGFFFGLTWPLMIRRKIFSFDTHETITHKRNRLQNLLQESEEEIERLIKIKKHIDENPKHRYLHLVDCKNISSLLQLQKEIHTMEKKIQKQKKELRNFKIWEDKLSKRLNFRCSSATAKEIISRSRQGFRQIR